MTDSNEQRARAVAARLPGAIPKVGQRDHWYLMLGVDNGEALAAEAERLRAAIRLLLWYADNGWDMRAGHGEALAEARFLVPRALDEDLAKEDR